MNNILIVEDQPDIREWIRQLVGEIFPAANFCEAATLEQARCLFPPVPDLMLTDLSLPDGMGYQLIRDIKRLDSQALCIVITGFEDDHFLFPALQAGADGYLLKDETEAEMKALLTGIIEGKPPISPAVAYRMFDYFRDQRDELTGVQLTAREKEVLSLIAKGYSVKECARLLELSHHTVAGYIKELYRKLEVNSRAEAALKASRMGLG